ncbi:MULTISPECIES: pyruvate, water dikinase regulatory protein [Clostridium]|uniref:Putative pyruvate, phosphate dikinase regulatory protein n=2 Tax=root TaxID=1 RepID=R9BRU6_9CLOT|nr:MULTISPECIES: pyruvate, water dikinase regulatory protein [Clostridium]EOR19839.1 PEP synthetase regulatory protein [Clostridium sartagoforme AAU1]KLE14354.1 phosphotransferase [Clostridium sp. C8]
MLKIFAVSDSIGETAEQVAMAAASQFKGEVEVKRIPYINSLEDVEELITEVTNNEKSIIVSTIITVNVREYLTQKCLEKNISVINVLGPIINVTSSILNRMPDNNPGAMRKTDEVYFKRIEAMEFAMQYDDSKDYRGLKNADVVLIGLSRTSKTPLCMYLANKGIKAINIPLMPEVEIPNELFEVDKKKIFGLVINPLQLIEIRKRRLDKFHRMPTGIEYASDARILEEFDFADRIMRKLGCKTIDVTQRAIEDTALIIIKALGHDR